MPLPAAILCTALLAGFWAIERKAFLQAMLSRPVVVGACLGLVWGMPWLGLAIGSVLELFFLGAVNIGASLPGNELWASLASLAWAFGLSAAALPAPRGSAILVLALAFGLPLARVGRHFDGLQESLNIRLSEQAQAGGREALLPSARLLLAGSGLSAVLAIALSLLAWAIGLGVGTILAIAATLPSRLTTALDRAFDFAALSMTLSSAALALSTLDIERALLAASISALIAIAVFFAMTGAIPWTTP